MKRNFNIGRFLKNRTKRTLALTVASVLLLGGAFMYFAVCNPWIGVAVIVVLVFVIWYSVRSALVLPADTPYYMDEIRMSKES